jgi:hypothetical protein
VLESENFACYFFSRSVMSRVTRYGFAGGVVIGLATMTLAPHPAGSLVFWGLLAAHAPWNAARVWRLTGLPFVTTAGILAGISGMLMTIASLYGHRLPMLPLAWAVPFFSLSALVCVCMVVEPWLHPREWELWRAHMEEMSAWDMFTGRSIPDLRHQRT